MPGKGKAVRATPESIAEVVKAADALRKALEEMTNGRFTTYWYGRPADAPETPWDDRILANIHINLGSIVRLGLNEELCEEFGISEEVRDELWELA